MYMYIYIKCIYRNETLLTRIVTRVPFGHRQGRIRRLPWLRNPPILPTPPLPREGRADALAAGARGGTWTSGDGCVLTLDGRSNLI